MEFYELNKIFKILFSKKHSLLSFVRLSVNEFIFTLYLLNFTNVI